MILKTTKIQQSLRKKGFIEAPGGSHQKYYYHTRDNLQTSIFTFFSRGSSYTEYNDSLIGPMCKQLRISKPQFSDLIECHLSQEGYEEILKEKGLLHEDP